MAEHTLSEMHRGLAGRATRFFHWWKIGLVACVPRWLNVGVMGAQTRWVLAIDDSGATAECLSSEGDVVKRVALSGPDEIDKLTGLMGANARRLTIRVPEAWVLHKPVVLPAAALRNIQQVLTYELDRLTPFPSKDVYFDFVLNPGAGGEGQIEVRLAVIQRFLIDKWIDGVLRVNLRPLSITTDGVWDGLNFARLIGRITARQKSHRSYFRLALVACAAVLVVAIFATPLWQKRSATIKLIQSVEQAKRKAEVVLGLKTRIEETESALNYVIEQRKNKVPVIEVLDLVTRLLPDDTWVQQLELKQDLVEIRGVSRQATRLIKLFEDSPSFTDAAFRSPVVQARENSRYHMAARLMVSGAE